MSAIISFSIYLLFVFILAAVANRAGKDKAFVKEYFLGSRNIGLWAFAFTYAATAASGGSFMGFPSLIYTHGWVVGWWIAGYMIVPMVALGLFAKRINQVSRIAGAITVPELLRKRFASNAVGNVATILVVFFMFFFLIAQFKAGAQIMATLLEGVTVYQNVVIVIESATEGIPWIGAADGDYLLCLIVFAVSVIIYTTYGGFRAVVWTDVMQGLVMGVGVVIMLVLALTQVGGLSNATRQLAEMTPPEFGEFHLVSPTPTTEEQRFLRGDWFATADGTSVVRLKDTTLFPGGETRSETFEGLRLTTPAEIEKIKATLASDNALVAEVSVEPKPYAFGADTKGVYTSAPGPSQTNPMGFFTVFLAFSFFAFWNFSGAGQPSYMVRQMAYRDTITLRRSMVMVAIYFSLIYFPLVLIFTSSRILLPGMEIHPDRVMPEMAQLLTANAGVPWLAGLLVAAPFAAVMSSVDSFLLLVSSSVVRDIYQENINPNASEKQVKRLSYIVTTLLGVAGVLAVLHPPKFLQSLIVFASAGLGACFLIPMVVALYWRRMTAAAAIAGMMAGGATILILYLIGRIKYGEFSEYLLLGFHPFIWSVVVTALVVFVVSILGKEPDEPLQKKFFGNLKPDR